MPSNNGLGNSRLLNNEIEAWIAKVERSVKDFSKKDRRSILVKASRPLVKSAKKKVPKGVRAHSRKDGEKRIKYNAGNLRRSIKRLPLRKSQDAFVGPQFARKKVTEYGGIGQPTDGYYAAMLFGSAAAFNSRVLRPALVETEARIKAEVVKASEDAIKKRAAQRGIKTR